MKNKKLVVGSLVLSYLLAAFFAFNAFVKLFPAVLYPEMPQQLEKIGLPMTLLPTIAVLELLCAIVYAIPATSVLGAVLFTGYLGGAILTHLRVGEAAVIQPIFGVLIWAALYVREPRLHALLPIRKNRTGE